MGQSRRTPRALVLAVALALLAGACSGGGDGSDGEAAVDLAPDGGVGVVAPGMIELVSLGDGSPYVAGLCALDLFHPGDVDDPIVWLIGEVEALPTGSVVEGEELAWVVERLRAAQEHEADDERITEELSAVAALLRARCA